MVEKGPPTVRWFKVLQVPPHMFGNQRWGLPDKTGFVKHRCSSIVVGTPARKQNCRSPCSPRGCNRIPQAVSCSSFGDDGRLAYSFTAGLRSMSVRICTVAVATATTLL